MTKLRVAIVAPSLDIPGGQAVQASRLLDAWRSDPEVEAWLVPVNPQPPGPLRWLTRMKYVRTLTTQAMYVPLLAREIGRADVVHIFSASYTSFLLAPLPAIVTAKMLGRPTLLNYHSGQAPDHLKASAIARKAITGVDANVVPSRFLVDVFASFGITATSIPNILDLDRFAYRPRVPLKPRLVCARNFAPLYNIACTLRAFAIVQRRWPDATLTLVGSGPEEPRLRTMGTELGLRNIRFAGNVLPSEVARFYADADIYLQSPNIDNMPLSILEAFASGLPVVSTGAGGIPVILTHGVHGLLAPVGDHQQLAAHVLTLLDNPAFANQLAAQANTTCQACTWSRVRAQWLHAYRSLPIRAHAA